MSDLVSRRSALRGAAVVVVGGIAGFALARNSAAAKQKAGTTAANAYGAGSSGGQLLAAVAAIPLGGGKIVHNPPVVLIRSGARVHAFSAICTHQGCTVSTVADGTIDCPCHGSKFDAATGKVVAGPAPSPLPKIPVIVRNGEVYTS